MSNPKFLRPDRFFSQVIYPLREEIRAVLLFLAQPTPAHARIVSRLGADFRSRKLVKFPVGGPATLPSWATQSLFLGDKIIIAVTRMVSDVQIFGIPVHAEMVPVLRKLENALQFSQKAVDSYQSGRGSFSERLRSSAEELNAAAAQSQAALGELRFQDAMVSYLKTRTSFDNVANLIEQERIFVAHLNATLSRLNIAEAA